MLQKAPEIPFWKGTNFYIAFILAFGGIFIGFPEGEARNIVTSIFALIGSVGAIREKVKGVDFGAWIKSSNTWNYLTTVIVSIFPLIPAELFKSIKDVLEAAIGGNWQGILAGLFSLGVILYNLFKKKPAAPAAEKARAGAYS